MLVLDSHGTMAYVARKEGKVWNGEFWSLRDSRVRFASLGQLIRSFHECGEDPHEIETLIEDTGNGSYEKF
jgi:hypothetical protein